MSKFGISQPVKRFENSGFLTGVGKYLDDITPNDALFAFVLRSNIAHGKIIHFDTSSAKDSDGIHLIITAKSLYEAGIVNEMDFDVVTNINGSSGAAPVRPLLAENKVRFVGEPIAMIIAETIEQAKDAAELIELEFSEESPHVRLSEGGPIIHSEAANNVAYDWDVGDKEAVDKIFKEAKFTTKLDIYDNRIIANSIEPRGCFAETEGDRIHLCFSGQGVWKTKEALQKVLKLNDKQIKVSNPDVGGGFGMKHPAYPEYFLVAQATRESGRSVRWQAERTESMLSDNSGRDLQTKAELAFDENYKILGYRLFTLSNLGAYNSKMGQKIQSELFSKVLMGTYDVQSIYYHNRGVFTNTTQFDAYRGAGRPEAIYVLERAMDHAARILKIGPLELRNRNFIPVHKFPYKTATGELYDVGEFSKILSRAETEADLINFKARKVKSKLDGKIRGVGICYYIESILGDPSETARIEFTEAQKVNLYVGTQSNGQDHETVYRQILHEDTGISINDINIVQGDSDLIPTGGGTGGSRSVTTQGTATKATAAKAIKQFELFLTEHHGLKEISFDLGAFRSNSSNIVITITEAANLARKLNRQDLLIVSQTTTLPGRSYPNGCHICEVEIDISTGTTEVVKYTVVDDLGTLINPMLARGQVHGGVVQGIGQAINEHVVYDENGQLLTATFMDYSLPRADNIPLIEFYSEPVPSTANPLGMKGCGEAGTVGALSAVANAVQDALWEHGIHQVDMPFTPIRVWSWLNSNDNSVAKLKN
jgi:carbon-monoxide dehydrogenase large subunit